MSKKYRFKKKRFAQQTVENKQVAHIHVKHDAADVYSYNTKSDFVGLFVLIIFCTGIVIGLYYYDSANNVLPSITDKILSAP